MKIKIENLFAYLLIALMLFSIGYTLYRQAQKNSDSAVAGSPTALEAFASVNKPKPNDSFLDLFD